MVFLDLFKAFDTPYHDIMLAVFWFEAYLTNRAQSVNVNGVFSDPQSIQFGIIASRLDLGTVTFYSVFK